MTAKVRIDGKLLERAQKALLAGQHAETLSLLADSPTVQPVLLLRGGALAGLARYEEAAKIFAAVLKQDPRQLSAAYNLALCQKALGRLSEAKGNLERVLKKQPGHLSAMLILNGVLAELGEFKAQEDLLLRGLALAPDEPRLRRNLAAFLHQRQRYDEALELAEALANAEPPDPQSLDLLGLIKLALGRKRNEESLIEDAIALFRRAVSLAPRSLDFRLHLGGAFNVRHETASDAQALFENLAKHLPDDSRIHHGLALAHLNQGRLSDARSSLERAVSCDPENAAAQHQLALVSLSMGDYAAGSRAYSWRWRIHEPPTWRPHNLPVWDGSTLTAGRLLVWSEQGLGEELLSYSWLRRLSDRGIAFGVECDPRLVGLLSRAFPDAEIYPNGDPRLSNLSESAYTAHCPCCDLLARTRPWEPERSPRGPFLTSEAARRDEFRHRLANRHDGLKVGISWFSKGSLLAFGKSLPLADWAPILATPDALFVNLQYGDSEPEFEAACRAAGAKGYSDPDLDRKEDLEGLCALIDSLDLVVTISNVTAHFAGALGKPALLLLGQTNLWHWGSESESVPFYPSLTALRAVELGGWQGVIETAAARLRGLAET